MHYSCKPPNSKTESQAELTEHDRILDGLTGPGFTIQGDCRPLGTPNKRVITMQEGDRSTVAFYW